MVINKSNPNKYASTNKIEKTEEQKKEEILEILRQESASLLALAHLYVKKFEETGSDITEKWTVAMEQNEILQQIYNRGYEDGISKGKELERENIQRAIDSINANGGVGKNTVSKSSRNLVQPFYVQGHGKGKRKQNKRK